MENVHPDATGILADLQSEDSDIIRNAAFTAADMRLEEAVPLLGERLKSENIGVQEATEYALRKIRGPQTIVSLLPLLRSNEAPVRNVAMDILREIGSDSVDSIESWLHDDDPDIRIFVADILGYCKKYKAVELLCDSLLKDPETNVRYQAAISLGLLAYPESVGALCKAMRDEEWVQFAVVDSLAKIKDASATHAMLQLLPHCSTLVSASIIDALSHVGDVKIIPMLAKSLGNVPGPLHHKIIKAIVQILSAPALALLPAKSQERLRFYLLEALTDNDEEILLAALQGLSAIGQDDATGQVLSLAENLNPERQTELYDTAVRVIASIGYNDTVRDALCGENERQIAIALDACHFMDKDDKRPLEDLKTVFWRLNLDFQRMAVSEIAGIATCEDMPFFLTVMNDCIDAEILKSSLIFFGNQHSCPGVEDIVFSQLDHRYPDVKEMALEACINLNTPTLNARFKTRFADGDTIQRIMAVYAMGRYGVKENLAEISQALEDTEPNIRQAAVETFLNLGSEAEGYLEILLPRLSDESKDVRLGLVDLLGQIGTPAVIPHLLTALQDENEWVRIRAIEALGVNRTVEAVPTLSDMLENASTMVALKIIESLGKIGGNKAFNVLLGFMSHEDPEIQRAAADAVTIIQAEQE
ncbi:MAG: HEAT repeat domain-containing protein [Desulfovibrio sp.]|jgi:HEAT repeat protein|nr:HEAT repeat domain-containing protein [Desulfovibrio sp.]